MRTQSAQKRRDRREQTFEWAVHEVVRDDLQRLLQRALELEAAQFVEDHANLVGSDGHRRIVRHGYMPERTVGTGIGPLSIRRPRVKDREYRIIFRSAVLRRYLRRLPASVRQIPEMHFNGTTYHDYSALFRSLLGKQAEPLDQQLLRRIAAFVRAERRARVARDLSGTSYSRIWVGYLIDTTAPRSNNQAWLIVIGAGANGRPELLVSRRGNARSRLAWRALLSDLRDRGLNTDPDIAFGADDLAVWPALARVFPSTRHAPH